MPLSTALAIFLEIPRTPLVIWDGFKEIDKVLSGFHGLIGQARGLGVQKKIAGEGIMTEFTERIPDNPGDWGESNPNPPQFLLPVTRRGVLLRHKRVNRQFSWLFVDLFIQPLRSQRDHVGLRAVGWGFDYSIGFGVGLYNFPRLLFRDGKYGSIDCNADFFHGFKLVELPCQPLPGQGVPLL